MNHLNPEKLKDIENRLNSKIILKGENAFDESNDINNDLNFDEEIIMTRHRYTEETIEVGKQFFKSRFINKKFQKEYDKNFDKNNNSIKYFDKGKIIKQLELLYLKKVEKAIFCFNLKSYMDSYNILLSNGIIENLEEFGEFLLIINGFDKFMIGEFLAKTHPPNENKIILKSFIRSINFQNIPFIIGFRFFLTTLNLPKDANLILDIMNYFSLVFYNDNKSTKLYKDSNSVYLLASTTLAVNTMFVRTDIKNVNKITKEQFVEMNCDVDKDTIINIYDDLKKHNIIWTQDYNEAIYRRLCIIVKEKEDIKFKNDDEMDDEEFEERIDNYSNRSNQERKTLVTNDLSNLSEDDVKLLKEGDLFYKFTNKLSSGNYKYLYFSNELLNIIFCDKKDDKKIDHSKIIGVNEIKDIIMGLHNNNLKLDEGEDKNLYFSFSIKDKILNFKGKNIEIVAKWYKAIKSLLNVINKKKENANNEKKDDKINDLIDFIWNNILSNWEFYSIYFLNQVKNKRSYHYNLNLKLEEIDDKKLNIKDIINKITNNKKLSKKEIFFIYENGLPQKIRKNLWNLLIGNKCGITEELFNFYLNKIEESIDFNQFEKQNNKNLQNKLNEGFNKIISDIIKVGEIYYEQICNNYNKILNDLYKIIRVFFLCRPDVIYSDNIIYIAMVILLNEDNIYKSFVCLVNLIFQNYLGKYLLKDNFCVSNFELFFCQALKTFCPKAEEHLRKFEINPSLFLDEWFESLFCKVIKYDLLIKLWDLFILKGDFIVLQAAIAIIILQQENILNLTINEILGLFNKIVDKNNIFLIMKKINIEEDFNNWKINCQLIKKRQLFFNE